MGPVNHVQYQSILDFLVESHFKEFKNITRKRLAEVIGERGDGTTDINAWIAFACDSTQQLERSIYLRARMTYHYYFLRETPDTSIADRVAHAITLPLHKFQQYKAEGAVLGACADDFVEFKGKENFCFVRLRWSFEHPLLKRRLLCRSYQLTNDIFEDLLSLGFSPPNSYKTPSISKYFTVQQRREYNRDGTNTARQVVVYREFSSTPEDSSTSTREESFPATASHGTPSVGRRCGRSEGEAEEEEGEEDEEHEEEGDNEEEWRDGDVESSWDSAETSSNLRLDSASPSSPSSYTSDDHSDTISAASLSDEDAAATMRYEDAIRRFACPGFHLEPLPPFAAAVLSVDDVLPLHVPETTWTSEFHGGWALKAVFRHGPANPRSPQLFGLRLLESTCRDIDHNKAVALSNEEEEETSGSSARRSRATLHDSAVERVLDNLPAANLVQLLERLYAHREIIQAMHSFSHLQRGMEDGASAHHMFMIDLWQLRYPAAHIRDVERSCGLSMTTDEKGALLEEYLTALAPQLSAYPTALRADTLLAFHCSATITVAAMCKLMDVLRPSYAAAGLNVVNPQGLIWPKWLDASWVSTFCASSLPRQKELVTKPFLDAFQRRMRRERQLATRRIVGAIPIVASEVPW